ncbi:DUF4870 domain-containing protein [Actinomycetes bacterium KLBMP 9797]
MTEPPRPPGEGDGGTPPRDPTSPPTPPASDSTPGEAPSPGYPPPPQPPTDGPPPTYGPPGYPPPGYPPGPPAGGYYGAPPAGYANADEKTWALISHFGGAAGAFLGAGTLGWIAPLVALLAKGNQSPTIRAHALAALNFQLLWSIITVVCWMLVCIVIGAFLAPIAMLIAIIIGIVAGVKANDGQLYRYPLTATLIK